ncbi:hypothetical protein BC829DRAFT_390974 [Chytridium lagenaria]|nr:hypothetical protein BC829DRAFT_390974 [Chytridium lagenaria]
MMFLFYRNACLGVPYAYVVQHAPIIVCFNPKFLPLFIWFLSISPHYFSHHNNFCFASPV